MEAKQQARFAEWLVHVPWLQPTKKEEEDTVHRIAHNNTIYEEEDDASQQQLKKKKITMMTAVEAYRNRRAHERALAERLHALVALK